MLKQLSVNGFALFDQVEIEFGKGLNILTGETGAGKSILIDALGTILGSRASSEDVRTGADRAIVEAMFFIDGNTDLETYLTQAGIDLEEDGSLLISREINNSGKSSCRLNGRIVTVSMLRQIGKLLIDLHGQHQHQSLLFTENHLNFLDNYGGDKLLKIKAQVSQFYTQIMKSKNELASLKKDESKKDNLISLLNYQIDEIAQANLRIGEDLELEREKNILSNAEKIYELSNQAYSLLHGNESNYKISILDLMFHLVKLLQELIKFDDTKSDAFTMTESIFFQLEDLSLSLRNYLDQIEFNPERLEQIENRLYLINQLKKKYGETIEKVLSFYSTAVNNLSEIENKDLQIEAIQDSLNKLLVNYFKKAKELSDLRSKFAERLSSEVKFHVRQLGMDSAKFSCQVEATNLDGKFKSDNCLEFITPNGLDRVEFLFSSNQGEPLKPLNKIASGGEISRLMLALKITLAGTNYVPTMIFDEIDAGVGGRTAYTIGDKLAELSQNNQIICVTHLPQIACMADNHYYIYKETEKNRTFTKIDFLSENKRIEELSRMLGGKENTKKISKEHAKELRILAQKKKKAAN